MDDVYLPVCEALGEYARRTRLQRRCDDSVSLNGIP